MGGSLRGLNDADGEARPAAGTEVRLGPCCHYNALLLPVAASLLLGFCSCLRATQKVCVMTLPCSCMCRCWTTMCTRSGSGGSSRPATVGRLM
jgi:hypothetical protein